MPLGFSVYVDDDFSRSGGVDLSASGGGAPPNGLYSSGISGLKGGLGGISGSIKANKKYDQKKTIALKDITNSSTTRNKDVQKGNISSTPALSMSSLSTDWHPSSDSLANSTFSMASSITVNESRNYETLTNMLDLSLTPSVASLNESTTNNDNNIILSQTHIDSTRSMAEMEAVFNRIQREVDDVTVSAMSDLQQELHDMRERVEERENELRELEASLVTAEDTRRKLATELQSTKDDLKNEKVLTSFIRCELQTYKRKYEDLEGVNKSLNERHDASKESIAKSLRALETAKSEIMRERTRAQGFLDDLRKSQLMFQSEVEARTAAISARDTAEATLIRERSKFEHILKEAVAASISKVRQRFEESKMAENEQIRELQNRLEEVVKSSAADQARFASESEMMLSGWEMEREEATKIIHQMTEKQNELELSWQCQLKELKERYDNDLSIATMATRNAIEQSEEKEKETERILDKMGAVLDRLDQEHSSKIAAETEAKSFKDKLNEIEGAIQSERRRSAEQMSRLKIKLQSSITAKDEALAALTNADMRLHALPKLREECVKLRNMLVFARKEAAARKAEADCALADAEKVLDTAATQQVITEKVLTQKAAIALSKEHQTIDDLIKDNQSLTETISKISSDLEIRIKSDNQSRQDAERVSKLLALSELENTNLQMSLTEYLHQNEILSNDLVKQKQLLKNMEKLLHLSKDECLLLSSSVLVLSEELRILKAQFSTAQATLVHGVDEAIGEYDFLVVELEAVRGDCRVAKQETTNAVEKANRRGQQIKHLKDLLKEEREKLAMAESALSAINNNQNSSAQEINEMREKLWRKDKQYDKLKCELKDAQSAAEITIEKLNNEIISLTERLSRIENDRNKIRSTIKSKDEKISVLLSEKAKAVEDLMQAERSLKRSNRTNGGGKNAHSSLENDNSQYASKVGIDTQLTSTPRKSFIEDVVVQANDSTSALIARLQLEQRERSRSDAKCAELEKMLKKRQNDISALAEQMAEFESQAAEAQRRFSETSIALEKLMVKELQLSSELRNEIDLRIAVEEEATQSLEKWQMATIEIEQLLQRTQRAENDLTQSLGHTEALATELSSLTTEAAKVHADFESLYSEFTRMQSELYTLKDDNELLKEERGRTTRQLENLNTRLKQSQKSDKVDSELKDSLTKAEQTIAELNRSLTREKHLRKDAQEELRKITEKDRETQDSARSLQSKCDMMDRKIHELVTDKKNKQNALETAQTRNRETGKELGILKQELAANERVLQQSLKGLDELEKERNTVLSNLAAVEKTCATLQTALQTSEANREEVTKKLNDVDMVSDMIVKRAEIAEKRAAALADRVATLEQTQVRLIEELETVKEELENKILQGYEEQSNIAMNAVDREKLECEINALKDRLAQTSNETNDIKRLLSKTREEKDKSLRKLENNYNSVMDRLKEEETMHHKTKETLRSKNDALKRCGQELSDATARVSEADAAKMKAEEEVKRRRATSRTAEENIAKHQNRISALETDLTHQSNEIDRLTLQLKIKNDRCQGLEKLVAQGTRATERAGEEAARVIDECAALQNQLESANRRLKYEEQEKFTLTEALVRCQEELRTMKTAMDGKVAESRAPTPTSTSTRSTKYGSRKIAELPKESSGKLPRHSYDRYAVIHS